MPKPARLNCAQRARTGAGDPGTATQCEYVYLRSLRCPKQDVSIKRHAVAHARPAANARPFVHTVTSVSTGTLPRPSVLILLRWNMIGAAPFLPLEGARMARGGRFRDLWPARVFSLSHIRRCLRQSGTATIGRRSRSPIGSRPLVVRGRNRICSWMSGAKFKRFMIWVTHARVTWPSRAISA